VKSVRKIFWLETAEEARQTHIEAIAETNLNAALKALDALTLQLDKLRQFPQMGRLGRVEGTRELIISGTKFIVVYRVINDQIQVLNFLHTAQGWP
jgi:toxin ParE1/3/4